MQDGPQLGVARDGLGQRPLADDVGEREPPARCEGTGGRTEHGGLVGGEVDDAVGHDQVDAPFEHRRVLDVPLHELDVGDAGLAARSRSAFASCSSVMSTPVTAAVLADEVGEREAVRAGPAAQVQHAVPVGWRGEVEEVPDAGERLDRGGRHRIEQAGG